VSERPPRWDELPPVTEAEIRPESAHGSGAPSQPILGAMMLCTVCDGQRRCWLCRGAGVLSDGKSCGECLGRKYCIGCDGGGVMPRPPS
jgi:hypothetical protein